MVLRNLVTWKMKRSNYQFNLSDQVLSSTNKLNRPYKCEYNYLRKTYITQLEVFGMQNMSLANEHSNKRITNKHYINEIEIAKFIANSSFRVFPKDESVKDAPQTAPNEKAPDAEATERLDFQCGE